MGRRGIPFYRDASGMLLRKTLFALGVNPDFVYITNVVKCNPPGNRLRGGFGGEGALELLRRELEIVGGPKAIFAVGEDRGEGHETARLRVHLPAPSRLVRAEGV